MLMLEIKSRSSRSPFMRQAAAFYLAKHKRFPKPIGFWSLRAEEEIKSFQQEYPHLLLTLKGAYVQIDWCSCKERIDWRTGYER